MILDVNLPGLPTSSSCLLNHMCVFVLSLNHIAQPRAMRTNNSLPNLGLDHGKLNPKNRLTMKIEAECWGNTILRICSD